MLRVQYTWKERFKSEELQSMSDRSQKAKYYQRTVSQYKSMSKIEPISKTPTLFINFTKERAIAIRFDYWFM